MKNFGADISKYIKKIKNKQEPKTALSAGCFWYAYDCPWEREVPPTCPRRIYF